MKILITILVLFSPSVFAETWSCTYEFNNKTEQSIVKRSENTFLQVYEDFTSPIGYDIIKENDQFIHLYLKIPNDVYAYIMLLDKNKKAFLMVGLEYQNSTEIIEGPCIVFEWFTDFEYNLSSDRQIPPQSAI